MKKFWIGFWYGLSILNVISVIISWYQGSYNNDFTIWAVVCLLCANKEEQELEIKELKEKMNKYE